MKLECLQKEGSRLISILYLDDEPWKELHRSVFGRSPKIRFKAQTLEEAEDAFHAWEYSKAKNYCLRLLAKRNYSSFELAQKLQECSILDSTAQKILHGLQDLGYIDDIAWIETFIRSQMEKKQGPRMVAVKLKKKGVPQELIESRLEALEPHYPQQDRIQRLLETKYRNRDLSNYKEKQKIMGALFRKGFDIEEIKTVLNKTTRD